MSTPRLVMLVAVCALVTFLTRAFPFLLFSSKRRMPEALGRIINSLPPAIIAVLLIYCIKGDITAPGPGTLASLAGIAAACALQLWKKNILISIAGSTVLYMALIRISGLV